MASVVALLAAGWRFVDIDAENGRRNVRLWIAASEEAHLFGWFAREPTPEEAIELVGAVCLGLYALELVAERIPKASMVSGPGPPRPPTAPGNGPQR